MRGILKDLLNIAGITTKKSIVCKVIVEEVGGITEELTIESLEQFIRLYPEANAIIIEVEEPNIVLREEFRAKLL